MVPARNSLEHLILTRYLIAKSYLLGKPLFYGKSYDIIVALAATIHTEFPKEMYFCQKDKLKIWEQSVLYLKKISGLKRLYEIGFIWERDPKRTFYDVLKLLDSAIELARLETGNVRSSKLFA